MNPKVTIATITYNSAQFVESVLAQSFTDLLNDWSTITIVLNIK